MNVDEDEKKTGWMYQKWIKVTKCSSNPIKFENTTHLIYSKYISSPKISHNNQETEKKAVLFPTLSNTNTKAFAHL